MGIVLSTWEGHREADTAQIQLDLGQGLLLVRFELVGYIHKYILHGQMSNL